MRVPSWFLMLLVIFAVVATGGTALFTYTNVRQFVAEAPIALPTLGSLGDAAPRPTLAALLDPTTAPILTVPTAVSSTAPTAVPLVVAGTALATAPATAANVIPTQAATTPTLAALTDPTRVTILLMGIDQRKGEKGPFRTDTMIVLSLDPARKTGVILSVPRDIYIQIPGYAPNRINTAEGTGEINDYPGGGSMLAVKTVEALLGVPIQHFMLINFDVFDAVINAVGPVRVCPPTAIHDNNYPDGNYGIITVDFPAGCQDLDATKLLEYARVRHNAGDDFGRAQRQQEVIRAVRDKILSLGGMSALITQASTLWGTVKSSLQTDMTLDQMIQLAQVAQSIPKENISSQVLSDKGGYLLPSTTAQGDQVLSPVYEKIHALIAQMFNAPPGSSFQINDAASGAATLPATVSATSAAILISNGAGVDGLAKSVTDRLRSQGFTLLAPKNSDLPGGYAQTVIRVYTGNIQAARTLAQALGLDASTITPAQNGPAGVDIEVVVGKDLALTATPGVH